MSVISGLFVNCVCVSDCEYWRIYQSETNITTIHIQCSCFVVFGKWSQPKLIYFYRREEEEEKRETCDHKFKNTIYFFGVVKWTRRWFCVHIKFNMTDEMMKRTARSGGCRLCLAPDTECISIFSLAADKEPIANKIHACVSIKVSRSLFR